MPLPRARPHCQDLSSKEAEIEEHNEPQKTAIRKLIAACCVCLVFMVVEVIAGLLSGSLALLSDASHLLSDVCSFLIGLFAIWVSTIQGNSMMSFGYHRAEIFGALISVMIIWFLSGYLVYAAWQRLWNPVTVDGRIMFVTAVLGTLANLFMTHILHFHSHKGSHHHHNLDDANSYSEADVENDAMSAASSLQEKLIDDGTTLSDGVKKHNTKVVNVNLRAAYLHALGDLLQNIGVMLAAAVIWWNPKFTVADPLCAFLFSIFVVLTTGSIIKDSVNVLMEGTPDGLDIEKLSQDLLKIENVEEIHDLHVWSLSMGRPALACHLVVSNEKSARYALQKGTLICQEKYGILHTTIQTDCSAHKPCCETVAHQMCQF